MTCIIFNNVSPKIKGYISRFLLEISPKVFVGTISKTVRENLWEYILLSQEESIMIYSSNNNINGYEVLSNNNIDTKAINFNNLFI